MASLTQEMGTPTPNWNTFELFPEVPTELRRKIWHATVDWKPRILPRRRISELEVCRESREFLLEIYQPCFLSLSERKEEKYWDALYIEALAKDSLIPISLYANFETDILFFDSGAVESSMRNDGDWSTLLVPGAPGKVRHLSTDWDEFMSEPSFFAYEYMERERIPMVGDFGGLKTISLMVSEYFTRDEVESREEGLFEGVTHDSSVGERVLQVINIDEKSLPSVSMEGTRFYFSNITRKLPDWKVPELQFARICRDGGS